MTPLSKTFRPILIAGTALLFFAGCSKQASDGSANEKVLSGAPDVAIGSILKGLAGHDGGLLWEAMPSTYQGDVNEIVQLAGGKLDAELYDKGFGLVDRVVDVLGKQQDFVFNTTLGTRPPEEQIAAFKEAWPSIENLVKTLTQSPIGSAEGLKSFDGATFFSETVSPLLKDIDVLSKLDAEGENLPISEYKDAVVTLLSGDDSEAMLEIKLPNGVTESQVFTKVSNRWVPKEMAGDWANSIAQARAQLEAVDPAQIAEQKPQILSILAMIDGVLTQIESAGTQEEFDQALQGAMMPLMGLLMMGQGLGGSGGGMPPISLP